MADDAVIPEMVEEMGDSAPTAPVGVDFADFFARHQRPVATALALTLHDDDLAADATAEAMARAYQRWDAVSGYRNPPGWVYRVGLNWARSRRRRIWREIRSAVTPDHPAPAVTPADPELADALAGLPVEQRSVVVLRYLMDWSESQVAEALQIAPGTVKSRLSRALTQLSRVMGPRPETERPETEIREAEDER